MKKTLRICKRGHEFYKSSDCPTCPRCEKLKKPAAGFLSVISAPARRALDAKKITSLQKLSKFSLSEILELHGMGPSTIPVLKSALKRAGLDFRSE